MTIALPILAFIVVFAVVLALFLLPSINLKHVAEIVLTLRQLEINEHCRREDLRAKRYNAAVKNRAAYTR